MRDLKSQKEIILGMISELFGDIDADEGQQAQALEEIAQLATDNAEVLREQIKSRCRE